MQNYLLPPERPGHAADRTIRGTRKAIADAVAAGVWETVPAPHPVKLNGMCALRFDPPGKSRATIVHFHGGAYRMGLPEQVAPFAAALAVRCGVTVLCPKYRLAPEYPFPAALNDGLALLQAVKDGGDPLMISGDSAGGGLAAVLTALFVSQNIRTIGLILLSAWLDLRVDNSCYTDNAASDPIFSREAAKEAAALYLQGASAEDPRVSPLRGSVKGFPPTLVNYGRGEVLAQDSRAFVTLLECAGTPVVVSAIAGMEHVAVTRGLTLPGASETLDAVCSYVDGRVDMVA